MNKARVLSAATAMVCAGLLIHANWGSRPQFGQATGGSVAAHAALEGFPEELAADGTTIVVGDPDAPTAVRLYEDPRCPVVADFEATGARALRARMLRGEARAEYTLASFKDGSLGGEGSRKTVNALRAALDQGKFAEFHALVFENATVIELSGGHTTETLLELAGQVEGLRGEAFDSAVRTMKYEDFVTASEEAFEADTSDNQAGSGTPTVVVNGTTVEGFFFDHIFEEESFDRLLKATYST
ncbi:DsbA family protein [Streptomyces sp. CO7]